MSHYFFKAVLDAHIHGKSLMKEGLDPKKRNLSGGATTVAAAQSGRALSAADSTSFGQCLTGNQQYAESYANTDNHRLLRITLPDDMISYLVRSAGTYDDYANMQAAVKDKECTAKKSIPPKYIEYLTHTGQWQSITTYPNPTPKSFDDDQTSDSEDWV
ncbi:MAG: hypothetical protein NTX45_22290 [Proteobacteria bacterium]|nr:hypothetical protein [Pseudomonadota bacterium]